MSTDGTLPPGVRHGDESDRPRPWLNDDEPHHAGDDDDNEGDSWTDVACSDPWPEPEPTRLAPEPERLACRQCGKPWDEPRLSPDGVCPLCLADLNER